MVCHLMGIQRVSFDTEKGEHVEGVRLHVMQDLDERSDLMTGHRCAAVFTRLPTYHLAIGEVIDFVYDTPLGATRSRLVRIDKVEREPAAS